MVMVMTRSEYQDVAMSIGRQCGNSVSQSDALQGININPQGFMHDFFGML